jgi:hypothetical protein
MRTVVGRVEQQQHNCDRHQATEVNKDTYHCVCVIPGNWSPKDEEAPGEVISGGSLYRQLGTSANSTILTLVISPPDHAQYVATVRHQRDLIPPEIVGRQRFVPAQGPQ